LFICIISTCRWTEVECLSRHDDAASEISAKRSLEGAPGVSTCGPTFPERKEQKIHLSLLLEIARTYSRNKDKTSNVKGVGTTTIADVVSSLEHTQLKEDPGLALWTSP